MNRVVPGFLLAAGWLLVLYFANELLFSAVLLIIVAIASQEYVRMIVKTHEEDGNKFFLIPLLVLPVLGLVLFGENYGLLLGVMASFVLLSCSIFYLYNKIADVFKVYSQAVFGLVYVGCLFAFLLMIYRLPSGNLWLIILASITAGTDTGAYVLGTRFGKHKLCPHISPKKSVEGAVGGLIFGMLFGGVFTALLFPERVLLPVVLAAGFLSAISMVGDLVESIVKRATGTKDSGTLLAGHGGVLDRMDSMMFAAPFLYYFLVFGQGI